MLFVDDIVAYVTIEIIYIYIYHLKFLITQDTLF